MSPVG